MSVTVVNVGMFERDTSGRRTTNLTTGRGDRGTVSVVVQGQTHTFGPGQRKGFSDDGIGIAVAAADGRLRVADTRDGVTAGGAS